MRNDSRIIVCGYSGMITRYPSQWFCRTADYVLSLTMQVLYQSLGNTDDNRKPLSIRVNNSIAFNVATMYNIESLSDNSLVFQWKYIFIHSPLSHKNPSTYLIYATNFVMVNMYHVGVVHALVYVVMYSTCVFTCCYLRRVEMGRYVRFCAVGRLGWRKRGREMTCLRDSRVIE